jgi:hypothetical protein
VASGVFMISLFYCARCGTMIGKSSWDDKNEWNGTVYQLCVCPIGISEKNEWISRDVIVPENVLVVWHHRRLWLDAFIQWVKSWHL